MFLNHGPRIPKEHRNMGLEEEDLELFQRMHKGDKAARETLILKYTNMVHVLVSRYVGKTSASVDDLRQVGMVGLIIAIDKFDSSLGYSVTTYARWKVLSSIAEYLNKEFPIIRVPMSKIRIYKKFFSGYETWRDEDIPEDIKLIGLFLNNQWATWNDNKVMDNTPIKKEWEEELAFINKHFQLLNEREKYILKGIFAGKSLPKIAGELSLSHETVRQCRKMVVQKLKRKRMVAYV